MEIDYKISEKEYIDFNLFIQRDYMGKKYKVLVPILLGIFAAYCYGLYELYEKNLFYFERIFEMTKAFLLYFFPVAMVVLLGVKIVYGFLLKMQAKKFYQEIQEDLQGSLSIGNNELIQRSKNALIKTDFKKLKIYKDKHFYIFISILQAYILPINEESLEFVKKLCEKTNMDLQDVCS
ncbi:MAG: hypothetical protein CR967_02735 [Proteobacteria bacterium]|nr:MAG: hypothetical protein CR967_02735 [Pseudomonadota bacterium]